MDCPHLTFLAFLSHYTPPLTNQLSIWLSSSSGVTVLSQLQVSVCGANWPTTSDLPPLLSFTTQGQLFLLHLIMLNCSIYTNSYNVWALHYSLVVSWTLRGYMHGFYCLLCWPRFLLESTLLNTCCHSHSPVKALDQGTSLDLEFILGHCTLHTGPLGKVKFVH